MLEEKLEELFDDIGKTSDADVVSIISKSRVRMLMEDYPKVQMNDPLICNALRMRQRLRNKAFGEAIGELLKECEQRSLHPVFFKGIFLASLLYERVENRISNDIDIIVPIEQFLEYNEVLEYLGYVREPIGGNDNSLDACYKEVQERHLGYIKSIENVYVHIEVHTAPVNPATLFVNDAKEFIASAKQEEILGFKPYLFDCEHNLVALALHFFKHLPLTYFQNLIFKREFDINLLSVHDIANLAHQYHDDIDWNKVLEIVKKMRVVKYFYFVARFVNNIYGEIFDGAFLENLILNINHSQISTADCERGGLGKLLWLFDIYIDYCITFAPAKMLAGRMADGFNLVTVASNEKSPTYIISQGKPVVLERHFCFDIKNNDCKDVKVDLKTVFSKRGLHIRYCVENKLCCPVFDNSETCYKKDGIEIIVVKDDSVEHRMLTIKQNNSEYMLVVYSNNNEMVADISEKELKYKLDVYEQGFEAEIIIPWSNLKVNSSINKSFLVNIAGLVSGPVSYDQERACCLFCNDKTIWDFRGIGEFVFDNND